MLTVEKTSPVFLLSMSICCLVYAHHHLWSDGLAAAYQGPALCQPVVGVSKVLAVGRSVSGLAEEVEEAVRPSCT